MVFEPFTPEHRHQLYQKRPDKVSTMHADDAHTRSMALYGSQSNSENAYT